MTASAPVLANFHPAVFSEIQPNGVVTPSVPSPGDATLPNVNVQAISAPSDVAFRISRAPAGTSELEVHFTLNAYAGSQAASQDGSVVIAPESSQVDLSAAPVTTGLADPAELLLLTVKERPDYRVGKRSATAFTVPARNACSEAALLGAFQQGRSEEAFGLLVERYRNLVFQTGYRLLGNRHDAEDVMQFVFLALAQGPLRLRSPLGNWLRTVARHAAIMVLRSRNRRGRHERQAARPEVDLPEANGDEWGEELDAAIEMLPSILQEAVRLRYLEGRSQHEAAAMLGVPRGTVAQRAARGIHRLREVLALRGAVSADQALRPPIAQTG